MKLFLSLNETLQDRLLPDLIGDLIQIHVWNQFDFLYINYKEIYSEISDL